MHKCSQFIFYNARSVALIVAVYSARTSLVNPYTGNPEGSGGNLVWQGDKVAAKRSNFDVLLRKRA